MGAPYGVPDKNLSNVRLSKQKNCGKNKNHLKENSKPVGEKRHFGKHFFEKVVQLYRYSPSTSLNGLNLFSTPSWYKL